MCSLKLYYANAFNAVAEAKNISSEAATTKLTSAFLNSLDGSLDDCCSL